jgi:hypothetical protein
VDIGHRPTHSCRNEPTMCLMMKPAEYAISGLCKTQSAIVVESHVPVSIAPRGHAVEMRQRDIL